MTAHRTPLPSLACCASTASPPGCWSLVRVPCGARHAKEKKSASVCCTSAFQLGASCLTKLAMPS
eukprot:13429417-Alexandrium_andersonii.AAC.1